MKKILLTLLALLTVAPLLAQSDTLTLGYCKGAVASGKRVRDASIYASKKISLKFLFLSDIFLFPPIRQQVPILA